MSENNTPIGVVFAATGTETLDALREKMLDGEVTKETLLNDKKIGPKQYKGMLLILQLKEKTTFVEQREAPAPAEAAKETPKGKGK